MFSKAKHFSRMHGLGTTLRRFDSKPVGELRDGETGYVNPGFLRMLPDGRLCITRLVSLRGCSDPKRLGTNANYAHVRMARGRLVLSRRFSDADALDEQLVHLECHMRGKDLPDKPVIVEIIR